MNNYAVVDFLFFNFLFLFLLRLEVAINWSLFSAYHFKPFAAAAFLALMAFDLELKSPK